jgi:hypothetical protein
MTTITFPSPVHPNVGDDGDTPRRYDLMTHDERTALLKWIRWAFTPAKKVWTRNSSYSAKHWIQQVDGAFYDNAQFKGGMLASGYSPYTIDGERMNEAVAATTRNWHFRFRPSRALIAALKARGKHLGCCY